MREYLPCLKKNPLFAGIAEGDLLSMLTCLDARAERYPKGAAVLRAGDPARYVGVVLRGEVLVCRVARDGARLVLASIPAGGLFGESYACAGVPLPVSAWAGAETEVLLLPCRRVVGTCPRACPFHARLVSNLLGVLAEKNIQLGEKIRHLSKRTIREKLLSYLGEQAARAGSPRFTIPFDRQGLADYLCVDRSALSRELGRLRAEGVLEAERGRFTLNLPLQNAPPSDILGKEKEIGG